MAKEWIAATRVEDESVDHYDIREVDEDETREEAIRKMLASELDYDDEEEVEYQLSRWDIFIFYNANEVEKLKKIDPPDYVDDLGFAVSEMYDSVFRAFADERVRATAEVGY